MSAELSQAEIDALLNAVGGDAGEGAPAIAPKETQVTAREYDFRRPDRLSRDHLRAFQSIYQNFARGVNVSLGAYFRTLVQVTLTTITQGNYDELTGIDPRQLSRKSADDTVLCAFTLEPLAGNAVLYMSAAVALAALDRLLGGQGQAALGDRAMTDLELFLMSGIVERMLSSYAEAWETVIALHPRIGEVVQSDRFAQFARRSEAVVAGDFEIRFGEHRGELGIIVPYTTIEPLLPNFTEQFWMGGLPPESSETHRKSRSSGELAVIQLPVAVHLGTMRATLGALAALSLGDVLRLTSVVGQPLDVAIGGRIKYRAIPGLSGRRLAVRITGPVGPSSALPVGESQGESSMQRGAQMSSQPSPLPAGEGVAPPVEGAAPPPNRFPPVPSGPRQPEAAYAG